MFQVLRRYLYGQISPFLVSRTFQSGRPEMAKSKFEYVRSFETEERLDPRHWIVITLQCQNFEKLYQLHNLCRPNDVRLTQLMESSAKTVMEDFKELTLGYGFAGEFSLVFAKNTTLYRRRSPKLLTNLSSLMSSCIVHKWPSFFGPVPLSCPPVFEGSVHLIPDDQALRDYMTQRQLFCHRQNLYNTVYWALVSKTGLLSVDASNMLKGTGEGDQNEILFSRCNMNYNKEDNVFKKGSIILRTSVPTTVITPDGSTSQRNQSRLVTVYRDFTSVTFWKQMFILEQPTDNNPKTNYLKDLEKRVRLLPHAWMVVRIDGKGFHKFSDRHNFTKPNDDRSLKLMNKAALEVMQEFPDIVLSYGQSDEYSFVLDRYSNLLERQANKIMSRIVSLFAAVYVLNWSKLFENVTLEYSPAFDARVVLYPNDSCLRDYLSWRQADCHINNMYNTCFWTLIQSGNYSAKEAQEKLSGTFSKDKRAILLTEYNRDYDDEAALHRKGTIMFRSQALGTVDQQRKLKHNKVRHCTAACQESSYSQPVSAEEETEQAVCTEHIDMIGDNFWIQRPWILGTERCAKSVVGLE